jgi:hypothetical protein
MTPQLFENRPYWALCAIVFVAMLLRTANGVWGGDFWEHAAVIRELMAHPTEPTHPLIATNAPNAFITPYSVALASVARWFSLSPLGVLSIAGMVNLVLLFFAFEQFVVSVFGSGRTAFYGLLFHLFLWGWQPWAYSGFLHFGSLGYVLPYPSTLAIAFVFLGLALTSTYLERPRLVLLLGLFGFSGFVLLVHALSALVLVAGQGSLIVAQLGDRPRRTVALGLHLAATFCVAFGAAAFWPYFPFLELMAENAAFHDSNPEMYQAVLARVFPTLVGLLALWWRFRANRFDAMTIMFISLSAIYGFGWVSGLWTYGRVLAFMVLILHLVMADWLAKRGDKLAASTASVRRWLAAGAVVMAIFAAVNFRDALRFVLPVTPKNYTRYLFLEEHVGQYDIVMADARTSWYVPPFGGKVVAGRSMAFISDRDKRLADVWRFFSIEATAAERRAMLERYDVDYLLLNKSNRAVTEAIRAEAAEWGWLVYSDENFELLQLFDRKRVE